MSTPVDRIQGVILEWVPDDLLCKQDALAALAELERERDELRAKLTQAESTIAFEQKNLAHQSERMAELRAKLAEYEQAPAFTYMYRFPNMGGFVWRHSSSDFNGARPVESIELIARPARKGE